MCVSVHVSKRLVISNLYRWEFTPCNKVLPSLAHPSSSQKHMQAYISGECQCRRKTEASGLGILCNVWCADCKTFFSGVLYSELMCHMVQWNIWSLHIKYIKNISEIVKHFVESSHCSTKKHSQIFWVFYWNTFCLKNPKKDSLSIKKQGCF